MRELRSGRHRRLPAHAGNLALTTAPGSPHWRLPASTGNLALTTALGLCLCAGPLAGVRSTPAAPSAAEPAPAMTTVAAAARKPRLTMSIPDRSIRRGSKVKVVARVIDPSTGRAVKRGSVRLQGFRHGAYRIWQIRRVGSSGRVTFWSKPSRTAAMRVVYFGAGRYRNTAIKRGVRVTVRARNGSSSARILAEARRQRGKRYVFGAAGPNTFDCSGYTMYVYRRAVGKWLPHNANAQQRYGWGVSHRNMRGGDLIVFRRGSYGYHVGIYAGGGYMWAAPHSGDVVRRQRVYSNNYVVRRLA